MGRLRLDCARRRVVVIIICDLIVSIVITIGVCWQYFIHQSMEVSDFFIALLLCYTCTRYLLMTSLEFHILSSLEFEQIDEEEELIEE